MGVSTNGQLSYGVMVKKDYELPWDDDIDDWWLDVSFTDWQEEDLAFNHKDIIDWALHL